MRVLLGLACSFRMQGGPRAYAFSASNSPVLEWSFDRLHGGSARRMDQRAHRFPLACKIVVAFHGVVAF